MHWKAFAYVFYLDLLLLGDYVNRNKRGRKIYVFALVHYKYLHILVKHKSELLGKPIWKNRRKFSLKIK